MQYPLINYGYFISQFTTFIYLPVNFIVILLKLAFTDDISEQSCMSFNLCNTYLDVHSIYFLFVYFIIVAFPKWKFAVMGLLDSLQGLLIVIGGLQVPGIMQNLLLQGIILSYSFLHIYPLYYLFFMSFTFL